MSLIEQKEGDSRPFFFIPIKASAWGAFRQKSACQSNSPFLFQLLKALDCGQGREREEQEERKRRREREPLFFAEIDLLDFVREKVKEREEEKGLRRRRRCLRLFLV